MIAASSRKMKDGLQQLHFVRCFQKALQNFREFYKIVVAGPAGDDMDVTVTPGPALAGLRVGSSCGPRAGPGVTRAWTRF